MTSRTRTLREALGWSQKAMAEFLGVEQPTVHRLDHRREESGPESRLLDLLSSSLESGQIVPGCTPSQALAAIGIDLAADSSPPPAEDSRR